MIIRKLWEDSGKRRPSACENSTYAEDKKTEDLELKYCGCDLGEWKKTGSAASRGPLPVQPFCAERQAALSKPSVDPRGELPRLIPSAASFASVRLQRAKEFEQGFLLAARERFEALSNLVCLVAMTQDGIAECQRRAVVHQPRAQSDSPQGRGANLVPRLLELIL